MSLEMFDLTGEPISLALMAALALPLGLRMGGVGVAIAYAAAIAAKNVGAFVLSRVLLRRWSSWPPPATPEA